MSKKFTMILTEQDIERALNQDYQDVINELVESADLLLKGDVMLVENRLSEQEYQILQEGAWEKIKFGLSKLGRYKAGGKIFGKGKIDQEAAAKIQSILDKKGNELIKKINNQIKSENPDFPNNEKGEQFLKSIMEIAAVYDSIVAATKKKPEEEGYLPTDAANAIIADLAEYVKKFLDVDLKGVYTVMDSEEEKVKDDEENEEGEEELLTDDIEDINEDEAADTRAKLQAKGGDTKYDTKRMGKEGLKSNKLPILLAGIGTSLGAFSWLTNTEWFKNLFQETYQYTDPQKIKSVIETKTQILNDIKPGEGVYKLLGRVTNHPLDGNSNPSEMINALKQIGGGDAHKGVDLLCQDGGVMMKPGEAAKGLHDLVNNPDQYDKLGDMFKGTASGTGKLAEPSSGLNTTLYGTVAGKSLTSLLVKKLPIIITKMVVKTGVKTGAGYAIAKGFGAVLGPIGIGLVTAGALVKLMRMKGLKQSRAKTLNDLLQSLQPIKAEEASLPPVLPEPPNPATGNGEKGGKNICNAKNLNELNKNLDEAKSLSQPLKEIGKYKDDSEFQKIFLDAFINTTKSVKINKKPLLQTLKDLQSQGLLEAPTSMSGRQRKYLKLKLELQNFMTAVMKLFASVYKGCKKNSKTFQVIKNFFKQLFNIASQGKSNISDEQTRKKLWGKLMGNFSQFLTALNKLPNMEKGKVEKTEGQPKKEKKGEEGTFSGSAPRTKTPELAHHDRGDNYLSEEITRIKKLMK